MKHASNCFHGACEVGAAPRNTLSTHCTLLIKVPAVEAQYPRHCLHVTQSAALAAALVVILLWWWPTNSSHQLLC